MDLLERIVRPADEVRVAKRLLLVPRFLMLFGMAGMLGVFLLVPALALPVDGTLLTLIALGAGILMVVGCVAAALLQRRYQPDGLPARDPYGTSGPDG